MAGKKRLREKPHCGSLLKDGSACRGVTANDWGDRCEHHGLMAIGAEHGWRVRGNRRAGVYVADQADRILVADTPIELLGLIEHAEERELVGEASVIA